MQWTAPFRTLGTQYGSFGKLELSNDNSNSSRKPDDENFKSLCVSTDLVIYKQKRKRNSTALHITTPNRELLTATDLLQCGVDSPHRLHYVGFQEMREVEGNNFLDSCTNTWVTCEKLPKQNFHCFPEFLKFCGFFILAIISLRGFFTN